MSTVKVLYFASIREALGKSDDEIEPGQSIDVQTLWERLNPGFVLPEASLVAVNQEYAELSSDIHPGDEVAFFPPVTGG